MNRGSARMPHDMLGVGGTEDALPGAAGREEHAQLRAYAEAVRESYIKGLQRAEQLKQNYLATVLTLASAVEAKDDYTGGHIHRVRLKGDPRTDSIPVLVLSADATRPAIANVLDAGARDYLTKPLDIRQFLGRVAKILGERQTIRS